MFEVDELTMTQSAELNALAVKVGEISGQLRELVHSQNNMSMKLDGLTEKLLTAPTQADFQALSARVALLEAEKNRTDGAKGVFAAVMRSPMAAWAAAIIAAIWGAFKGGLIK